MTVITVSESGEIPVTDGTVQVDTSKGSITLMLKPGAGKELLIKKISNDSNVVALYFPDGLIGSGEIIIFGLSGHSRAQKGKAMNVLLRGGLDHWQVVKTF